VSALDEADHAGAADTVAVWDPEFLQTPAHKRRRLVLAVGEFGVLVDLAPVGDHLGCDLVRAGEEF